LAGRTAAKISFAIVNPNAEIAAISTPQPEITVHRRIDATGLVLYGAARKNRR
jgi:hypothetical protein